MKPPMLGTRVNPWLLLLDLELESRLEDFMDRSPSRTRRFLSPMVSCLHFNTRTVTELQSDRSARPTRPVHRE